MGASAWIGSWLSPDFASWSLLPVLPQVKCPVLVVHGINDEYGSSRHPELIGQLSAAELPGSKSWPIRGTFPIASGKVRSLPWSRISCGG